MQGMIRGKLSPAKNARNAMRGKERRAARHARAMEVRKANAGLTTQQRLDRLPAHKTVERAWLEGRLRNELRIAAENKERLKIRQVA